MCINQTTIFNTIQTPYMGCGMLPTFTPRCAYFHRPPMPIPMMPPPPMPMMPMPFMPMYPMSGAMATGFCIGAMMGMPGTMNAIGTGLQWGYNNIIRPVWNSVVKPVWNFAKNEVIKPVLSGLRWVWDHTLGWALKKVEGVAEADKARQAEKAAEEAEEAELDAELDQADEADEADETNESDDADEAQDE